MCSLKSFNEITFILFSFFYNFNVCALFWFQHHIFKLQVLYENLLIFHINFQQLLRWLEILNDGVGTQPNLSHSIDEWF